ncbi:hypothetical protein NUBL21996_53550 [Klebsiella pneumoniae]|nr:hypothetical protein NUBL21996_53550 [Klebsiella pneumoniae]
MVISFAKTANPINAGAVITTVKYDIFIYFLDKTSISSLNLENAGRDTLIKADDKTRFKVFTILLPAEYIPAAAGPRKYVIKKTSLF